MEVGMLQGITGRVEAEHASESAWPVAA